MGNPLVMIASPEHPLAKRKNVSLQELAKSKFIVREQGSGTKAAIEVFFKQYGYKFESTLEMSSNEAIKHSVMAGLGLGIASLHTIKLELETKNLIIVKAEHFPIMRHWYIVRRKGKSLTPTAKAFQEFVIQEANNYMRSYKAVFPCY
jgi:DNA-binding transcriptional LysR family regulator